MKPVDTIPVYAGFDERESVGFHAFTASVIANTSMPVAITPLHAGMLRGIYDEGQRDGTNAFIYLRFLIPYLNLFRGFAIFVDGADMVCRGDLAELWDMRNPWAAVQVVQHDYKTRHPRKYVGTEMEAENADYPRKNWSSVMIINCGHFAWRDLTPDKVARMTGSELHGFTFLPQERIGELPKEWNWLADEYGPNPLAKLLHWTAGVPAWPAYANAPHADEWAKYALMAQHATA